MPAMAQLTLVLIPSSHLFKSLTSRLRSRNRSQDGSNGDSKEHASFSGSSGWTPSARRGNGVSEENLHTANEPFHPTQQPHAKEPHATSHCYELDDVEGAHPINTQVNSPDRVQRLWQDNQLDEGIVVTRTYGLDDNIYRSPHYGPGHSYEPGQGQ